MPQAFVQPAYSPAGGYAPQAYAAQAYAPPGAYAAYAPPTAAYAPAQDRQGGFGGGGRGVGGFAAAGGRGAGRTFGPKVYIDGLPPNVRWQDLKDWMRNQSGLEPKHVSCYTQQARAEADDCTTFIITLMYMYDLLRTTRPEFYWTHSELH